MLRRRAAPPPPNRLPPPPRTAPPITGDGCTYRRAGGTGDVLPGGRTWGGGGVWWFVFWGFAVFWLFFPLPRAGKRWKVGDARLWPAWAPGSKLPRRARDQLADASFDLARQVDHRPRTGPALSPPATRKGVARSARPVVTSIPCNHADPWAWCACGQRGQGPDLFAWSPKPEARPAFAGNLSRRSTRSRVSMLGRIDHGFVPALVPMQLQRRGLGAGLGPCRVVAIWSPSLTPPGFGTDFFARSAGRRPRPAPPWSGGRRSCRTAAGRPGRPATGCRRLWADDAHPPTRGPERNLRLSSGLVNRPRPVRRRTTSNRPHRF